MSEVYFKKKHMGLGGQEEVHTGQAVLGFALLVAGGCYMACVANLDSVYHEQ